MLSVGGSGARSRSKSPGRRDGRDERDRSRDHSRDIRGPSPARREPSPPQPPKSKHRYEDENQSLTDDSEEERKYKQAPEKAVVRRRQYDDDDDDDDEEDDRDHRVRYAEPSLPQYARSEDLAARGGKRGEDSRRKEYAIPGQFDEDDGRPNDRRDEPSRAANGHARAPSYSAPKPQYENLPQYQYQQLDPRELKYVKQNQPQYTRTPKADEGPQYLRNPPQSHSQYAQPQYPQPAQVTVASSRHRRTDSQDDRKEKRDERKDKYDDRRDSRRYVSDERRENPDMRDAIRKRELERAEFDRMEKERAELKRDEERRREIDHLTRLKEERESEMVQKRPKSVQIMDDRAHKKVEPKTAKRDLGHREDEYGRKRDDPRKRYDESESEESDEDEKLDRLYHERYPQGRDEYHERYEEHYEDRREDRRRDRHDDRHERSDRKRHEAEDAHTRPQVVAIHPGWGSSALSVTKPSSSGDRNSRLSVSGSRPNNLTLVAPGSGSHDRRGSSSGAPPASPLLESYRGTYQSISPMPSPMALAHHPDDSDLSDFELRGSKRDRKGKKQLDSSDESEEDSDVPRAERKPKSILKRAAEAQYMQHYDPENDAVALARELKGSSPDSGVVIHILPILSDDSISALRTEYKKHAKIQGKGINLAKHIKMKLGTTNLGKAAYATSLGRWESEAHWANFWYQSGSSRRELLIEVLFGRSNAEVKAIKEAFSDKRYGDSLVRCMEAELKKDKFRVAVLKALEAKRGDERDALNMKLVGKDVEDLHKALVSKEGGETAMINIIVVRSDSHLRAVMQEYEADFGRNFAREMIKKSQNLVGETLAHILNGVVNRPVRDALLLHQAIEETSKDRAELIISRLVRFHWEPKHLERVKNEYQRRYSAKLEHDIEDKTKGDFSNYCITLCRGAVR